MRTTKKTVIELDDNDEVEIRYKHMTLDLVANPRLEDLDSADHPCLQVTTDDVTWLHDHGFKDGDRKVETQIVSEEGCELHVV